MEPKEKKADQSLIEEPITVDSVSTDVTGPIVDEDFDYCSFFINIFIMNLSIF